MLIRNLRGDLYLQRRALHKDCDPGLWDSSSAGHVDRGEDYEVAAHRELRATDGLFWAQRRAQARLRQFLAWLGLDYIADLWELPLPPVEPI